MAALGLKIPPRTRLVEPISERKPLYFNILCHVHHLNRILDVHVMNALIVDGKQRGAWWITCCTQSTRTSGSCLAC